MSLAFVGELRRNSFMKNDLQWADLALANVYGLPAMSVPAGFADDLPIGAHFMAASGRDDVLFDLAYALEEAAPWENRRPVF